MSDGTEREMRRPLLLKILIGFAFLIAAFNIGIYLYGLTLPKDWHVEESITIAAAPAEIFPLIATTKNWPDWSAWSQRNDPGVEFKFEGPALGKDAEMHWRGEQLGMGRLKISEADQDRSIGYELALGGTKFSDRGRIELKPLNGGTRVTWTDGGDLGGTLGRLFGERLQKSISADFSASLERLKTVVEGQNAAGQ